MAAGVKGFLEMAGVLRGVFDLGERECLRVDRPRVGSEGVEEEELPDVLDGERCPLFVDLCLLLSVDDDGDLLLLFLE